MFSFYMCIHNKHVYSLYKPVVITLNEHLLQVPRQCLHNGKEAPPKLKSPNSWLPRLSAEHTEMVPLTSHHCGLHQYGCPTEASSLIIAFFSFTLCTHIFQFLNFLK